MLKVLRIVLAGMVLQLMAGQAFAQVGRGELGGTPSMMLNQSMMLVQQKSVQEELKLSEDQVEKLKQVAAKMRGPFGPFGPFSGRPGDREESRKQFAEAIQAAEQTAEKDRSAILTADQSRRLNEIAMQRTGPMALALPDVAKDVGLTDEQQAKVKEISDAYLTEMRAQFPGGGGFGTSSPELRAQFPAGGGRGRPPFLAAEGGGDREEARKKRATLRKDTDDKLLALLKDDQKKALEKLNGEPFKGEINPSEGNRPRNKAAQ